MSDIFHLFPAEVRMREPLALLVEPLVEPALVVAPPVPLAVPEPDVPVPLEPQASSADSPTSAVTPAPTQPMCARLIVHLVSASTTRRRR